MGTTSNQIKESDQRLKSALDELVEVRAEARAREIIGEFTVKAGNCECDIYSIDYENRILTICDLVKE